MILLLPGLTGFPYPPGDVRFSDMSLAHYPYAMLQKQAIIQEHRLRLWSPLILSGAPIAANPLAGLWYPPGWLAWILPLPLGFNLLIMLHMFLGGFGLYQLLRLEGLRQPPALIGAIAFEMMPKLFAHYGAGHVTLLYAVSWTPWLLYAARKRITEPSHRITHIHEALVMAAICLADIRSTMSAGAAW